MKKFPTALQQTTRRTFIQNTGSVAAALTFGAGLVPLKAWAKPSGANSRIGLGAIGCGGRGSWLLDLVATLNKQQGLHVEIVAVCDIYRPRLDKNAKLYNAKAYTDHRALLADPNVDAVIIATPDHIHGQQAIDAVLAGKDVYCEKPVTHWRQFELTKKLFNVVSKADRVFQLGSQYMSDSAWHQAAALIRQGLIGQPIHAECGLFRVGDFGEAGMPIDDPNAKPGPDLNWEAFLGDAPKREFDVSRFFRWRMYWDYAGGPATDLYPHCLSQVIHMLGVKLPSVVVATGGKFRYDEREVPDTFNMLIDYSDKLTVCVLGTQGNDHPGTSSRPPGRSPVIRGWEGTLTFEGEEIVFTPAYGSKKEAKRFAITHPYKTELHMKNFFDCCRTREKPECPIDLAYHVQTPLQMSILSLREGKVARFDADQEKIVL